MRRILPMIIVVLAATIPLFYLILLPSDYVRFIRSAFSTLKLTSDIFFRKSGGYFDYIEGPRPLLHTWSLSIEEKYYLLFPIAMWLAFRKRVNIRRAIIAATMIGLLISLIITHADPGGAYYTFSARIWQILAGAAVALLEPPRLEDRVSRHLVEVAGWVSLACLLCIYATFGAVASYPGWRSIAPVACTAGLLLAAHEGTSLARILSNRILVVTGLLSYSIYMWHQPVIVAAEELSLFSTPFQITCALLVILLLSGLSWRFVERPFRSKSAIPLAKFALIAPLSIAAVVVGAILIRVADLERLARVTPDSGKDEQQINTCFILDPKFDAFSPQDCLPAATGIKKVFVVGDSHAASLFPGLRVFGKANHFDVALLAAAGCLPIVPNYSERSYNGTSDRCAKLNREAEAIITAAKPDLIIVSGHMYQWVKDRTSRGAYESYFSEFLGQLARLRNIAPVMVVGQVPVWKRPLPDIVAVEIGVRGKSVADIPQFDRRWAEPDLHEFDETYRRAATAAGANYVSIVDRLCNDSGCLRYTDRHLSAPQLMTYDYGHLSLAASHLVADTVVGPAVLGSLFNDGQPRGPISSGPPASQAQRTKSDEISN